MHHKELLDELLGLSRKIKDHTAIPAPASGGEEREASALRDLLAEALWPDASEFGPAHEQLKRVYFAGDQDFKRDHIAPDAIKSSMLGLVLAFQILSAYAVKEISDADFCVLEQWTRLLIAAANQRWNATQQPVKPISGRYVPSPTATPAPPAAVPRKRTRSPESAASVKMTIVKVERLSPALTPAPSTEQPAPVASTSAAVANNDQEGDDMFLTVKLANSDSFTQHHTYDVATFYPTSITPTTTEAKVYRVRKSDRVVDFKARVAAEFGHRKSDVRLWVFRRRGNSSVRPDVTISDDDERVTMNTLRWKLAPQHRAHDHDLLFYLEYIDPAARAKWIERHGQVTPIMVFVKHFDAPRQSLAGIGHFHVHAKMLVGELARTILDKMEYPRSTGLKLYEELQPTAANAMNHGASFERCGIQHGDIVCFQVEQLGGKKQPGVDQYYKALANRSRGGSS